MKINRKSLKINDNHGNMKNLIKNRYQKAYGKGSPGVILCVFFWNCEGGYVQRHENQ